NCLAESGTALMHPCGPAIAAQLAASRCLVHSCLGHRWGRVIEDRAMAFGAIEKSGFQMSQDAVESKGTAEYPRFVKPQRVAFVQSAWHRDVVAECREAFLAEIEARHIARGSIDVFEVPGSFEIPLHVQLLAKTRRYTAIVAAGLVVDDDTIAETVIRSLMDVQLRTEIPVFSAVVTPQQFGETADAVFLSRHFAAKGVEVAEACANTLLG